MHVYEHFPYTGKKDRWVVPEGVTSAVFECWGAGGGMPSDLAWEGKKREVVGGTGPKNTYFYNSPNGQGQLGQSYANGAGYARGTRTVSEGEEFWVFVGGNGEPGHSTIKLKDDGTDEVGLRGGAGGWNGGGDGGEGAKVTQNLYNDTSTKVQYKRDSLPPSAKHNELWLDTDANKVKKCNTTYTKGNAANSKWDEVTHEHDPLVGPSGGGGGGATDIRFNGTDTSNRILIAGGGGGSAGPYAKTGKAAWTLRPVPATPAPPFGADTDASGATGPDNTWCTSINYLTGGWGLGGLGGGTGPKPGGLTTSDGGIATSGDSGQPGTDRHTDGDAPGANAGSGGGGGTNDAGGASGNGGTGAQNGSKGQGGNGADANPNHDDWCAGGGGGGGGYYGGGGGGQGFKSTGKSNDNGTGTYGGGGGGGSNYADTSFTQVFLGGAARPPFAKGNSGTGANGKGGFARISYALPPKVKWKDAPASVAEDTDFTVEFTYQAARTGGPGIAYYIVGTATDPAATFPTSQSTIMVSDATLTDFTHTFTAPDAGDQEAYFVQVVDTDGDASAWLKQKVTGITAAHTAPVTITAPTSGATFEDSATVDWTVGAQTPLVAYRLGVSGTATAGHTGTGAVGGWKRGGSRINHAIDPGFKGTSVWSSTDNADMATSTAFPGVSGSNGRITWTPEFDGLAEEHTLVIDSLKAGSTYRLLLSLASGLDDDPRPVLVQVWDDDGMIRQDQVVFSGAAGTYSTVDDQFTPNTQGVYIVVVPSGSQWVEEETGDPIWSDDFEGGDEGTGDVSAFTIESGFTATADGTNVESGDYALKLSGHGASFGATVNITSALTDAGHGAGWYVLTGHGYSASANDEPARMRVSGAEDPITGSGAARDEMVDFVIPFEWDGSATISVLLYGCNAADGDIWYDDLAVGFMGDPLYGNTDMGQITYLKDMLIEFTTEDDGTDALDYFDGSHANGGSGTASWIGTTNASASLLTGTDIDTDTATYDGDPLNDGLIFVETLSSEEMVLGYDAARATVSVAVNPNTPATPTVTLTNDSALGYVLLSIDAADGSQDADLKTTSFDIFRDGVRIVTGLTPDVSTRLASYKDFPATGVEVTYVVRAWSQQRGYADQSTGTVE